VFGKIFIVTSTVVDLGDSIPNIAIDDLEVKRLVLLLIRIDRIAVVFYF
jgi:hypothetical protein